MFKTTEQRRLILDLDLFSFELKFDRILVKRKGQLSWIYLWMDQKVWWDISLILQRCLLSQTLLSVTQMSVAQWTSSLCSACRVDEQITYFTICITDEELLFPVYLSKHIAYGKKACDDIQRKAMLLLWQIYDACDLHLLFF